MSFDVHGTTALPERFAPPPAPVAAVTQRDMATAARLGVQAVPARPLDPATGPAKRERSAGSHDERRATSDRERLDALRLAALRRDAAAITGRPAT
ncbi:MAG TPA: hypothetical protein VFG79_00495 [Solirubrobacter sp.]|nr:hypothetical protein [Solirubrobacter sp.]